MAGFRCEPCNNDSQSRASLWPALLRLLRFIPLNVPCVSSACLSQGCWLDLEACLPRYEGLEQRMEGVTAAITIGGATVQIAKTAKGCIDDYKDAEKQVLHAQHQVQQLRSTLNQLKELSPPKQERIAPAQALLNDIQGAFPTTSLPTRRKDRLQWIAVGKPKFERENSRTTRMETAATLSLLVSLHQDIEKFISDSAIRHEELKSSFQYPTVVHTHRPISSTNIRERRVAEVRHWNWLAKYFGIKSGVIVSTARDQRISTIFARWSLSLPLGLSQVITAQLLFQNGLPCLPKLGIRPQAIVAKDSEIIKACEAGDITMIQGILKKRQAHPNDRTTDDLTVLRYAILSGIKSIVELFLDHGADPNLPFGVYQTSPLDIAFRLGNVDIIRSLLSAGADLDYQNTRTWTAISYLWDPVRPALDNIQEILGICTSKGFSAWNETDSSGWTLCHRAGAFGKSEEIKNLHYKGGNMRSYTTPDFWGPMTCAVWNGNESTFDAFMDLLGPEEIVNMVDNSGWTLLHLAAENGSRHILKTLLDIGINPRALTVGPQDWMPDRLKWESLTAETIARENGHGEVWDSLVATNYNQ